VSESQSEFEGETTIYKEPWPIKCPSCKEDRLIGPLRIPFCEKCGWGSHGKITVERGRELKEQLDEMTFERDRLKMSLDGLLTVKKLLHREAVSPLDARNLAKIIMDWIDNDDD